MSGSKSHSFRKVRKRIYEVYGYRCAYSGVRIQYGSTATIDHVRSKREMKQTGMPDYHWRNLLPCHRILNQIKGDRSLEKFREYLLTSPTGVGLDIIGITRDSPFDGVFFFEKHRSMDIFDTVMDLGLQRYLYPGAYI